MMNDATSRQGQIVTFYSFKGGVGRTMALANVAWILASNGQRVLAVDWDLESPGLHRFFQPFLDASSIGATPGIIDIITDYALAATSPGRHPTGWRQRYARVLPHVVSLDWDFPNSGTIDFLSAGRQNRSYSSAVASFDWDNFYDRLGGSQFLEAMRVDMKQSYDYILIDCRTGLSDIADICTVQFPDTLIVCFTLNDQSIDGASAVARHVGAWYHDRNIRILPIPMRVEHAEEKQCAIRQTLARVKFDGLPAGLDTEASARYWHSVEIPYTPYYALSEMLAAFGDDAHVTTSLLGAYERLTAAITEGRIVATPPMVEEYRTYYRDLFTGRQAMSSADVFLSYVTENKDWADWIEMILTRSGYCVLTHNTASQQPQYVTATVERYAGIATRTVAVLSDAYLHSTVARLTWDSLRAADASRAGRQLVPVQIDGATLVAPFTGRNAVELAGLDAQGAFGALMGALGWSAHPLLYQSALSESEPRYPGGI
jgi:hypothetical protein